MYKILDVRFRLEKKGKVGGGACKMRSRNPDPVPFEETEASASSIEGVASLASFGEESSEEEKAFPIAEGLVILNDNPVEDKDEVPLARRSQVTKRKTLEGLVNRDPSPISKKKGHRDLSS